MPQTVSVIVGAVDRERLARRRRAGFRRIDVRVSRLRGNQEIRTNAAFIPPPRRPCADRRTRCLEQGVDLRHPEISEGLQSGDARIAIVGDPAGEEGRDQLRHQRQGPLGANPRHLGDGGGAAADNAPEWRGLGGNRPSDRAGQVGARGRQQRQHLHRPRHALGQFGQERPYAPISWSN